ncbi:hypothetical protein [Pseudomonas sp. RC10]|uniref:hypothetical protein n=1 Tax=Pseudomonas bambusae TaxID=3139142 RepID=UPI003138D78E
MTDINDIVVAENPTDVILFITRNNNAISYPSLDRLYSRNKWIHFANNLELQQLVDNMEQEGLISRSNGGIRKGPKWRAPSFLSENKYPIKSS